MPTAYTVLCAQADYEAAEGDGHRAVERYEQLLDKVMAAIEVVPASNTRAMLGWSISASA